MPDTRHRIVIGLSVVLLGAVLATAGTASASGVASNETTLEELPGDGTEENPYVINTVEELQAMEQNTSAHYALGSYIDAGETSTWEGGAGFDPVGDDEPFTGSLDGRQHSIRGITINRPSRDQVGIIAVSRGSIENVHLKETSITGGKTVGGLVAVNGGTVSETSVSGTIKATDRELGGLVGINEGTVTDSYALGTVEGTYDQVGGLVGVNDGNVDSSYAETETTGVEVVGGLIGANTGPVRASFSAGDVEGEKTVGGFAGFNGDAVNDVYSVAEANGTQDIGGLLGNNEGTLATSYAAGSVGGEEATGGIIGYNEGIVDQTYWNVNTTGQREAYFEADDEDVVGLAPAEITGENVTENTDLDFESTWNATETYPRLQWESDRYVPSSAHDVPVDAELPPEEPEEPETNAAPSGFDNDEQENDDDATSALPSPGFGVVAGLVAVLLSAAVARRR